MSPTVLRRLATAEAVLGAVAAVLAVVTLVSREWIEVVFGFEPDGGNGEFEWLLVGALGAVAVVLGLLARRHLRVAAQA